MSSLYWKPLTTLVVLITFAIPARMAAQAPPHQHYKLIDLGTLGGPHGYGSVNGDGFQLLNNSGVVGSFADTAIPDPNAPNCANPDCFLSHAFRWKDGEMTDLGTLGGNNSAAGSTNARGWMAGQSAISIIDPNFGVQEGRAALWRRNEILDLGTLPGGAESLSAYVNDSGQVVGFSDNGIPDPFAFFFPTGTQIHPFIWEKGAMLDLGTLGGPEAVPGASCSGQPRNVVAGSSMTSGDANASTGVPTIEPFVWKNGVMTGLGSLGGTIGFGQCANNRGQIIGMSDLSGDLVFHAFAWENGVMNDLGTLGGHNSEAIWLNDAGMIVGSADLPATDIHDAVVWINGKIQDLGTVPGDACSRGRGLNSRGQVVGGSSDCHAFLHAFVWEEGGPMLDLNTLIAPGSGWQLTNAININDRGEILAKAAPLGFTPEDDADLGHLVLLVPCDADDAGCGGSARAAASVVQQNSAPSIRRTAGTESTPRPRTPRENAAAWRARLARQYHFPVFGTMKK
jgi:probable HAF family extracellular repeat protein